MNVADEHSTIDQLLPWYANGSLDVDSRKRIAAHLEHCEACREELKFLGDVRQVLRRSVVDEVPLTHELAGGFESLPADLRQRVNADKNPSLPVRDRVVIPAIAAALFAAVGVGAVLTVAQLDEPRFRTATSVTATNSDHVQVLVRFAPDAQLQHVNEVLRQYRAVIVQGPDQDDRWILEIPVTDSMNQDELQTSLGRINGVQQVRLAGEERVPE